MQFTLLVLLHQSQRHTRAHWSASFRRTQTFVTVSALVCVCVCVCGFENFLSSIFKKKKIKSNKQKTNELQFHTVTHSQKLCAKEWKERVALQPFSQPSTFANARSLVQPDDPLLLRVLRLASDCPLAMAVDCSGARGDYWPSNRWRVATGDGLAL